MEENPPLQSPPSQPISSPPSISPTSPARNATHSVAGGPPPPISRPKRNITLILLILFITLILIASGSWYFLSNQTPTSSTKASLTQKSALQTPTLTPNPTKDWKTYTNSLLGFTIAYPNKTKNPYTVQGARGGHDVQTTGTEDNTVIDFPGNNPQYENAFSLEILPYNGTVENVPLIPTNKRLHWSGENGQLMEKNYIADNIPTIWYNYPSESSKYEVFLVKNNHVFIFHSGMEVSESLMEQILSTFTFTDPNQNADACSQLKNAQFTSVEQQVGGETLQGTTKAHWRIEFQDTTFTWVYTDIVQNGSFTCTNNTITTTGPNPPITATYNPTTQILMWQGVKYKKQ